MLTYLQTKICRRYVLALMRYRPLKSEQWPDMLILAILCTYFRKLLLT